MFQRPISAAALLVGISTFLLSPISIHGIIDIGLCSCFVGDINYESGDWRTLSEGLYLYPTRNSSSKNEPSGDEQMPIGGCPYTSKDASLTVDTIQKMVTSFYSSYLESVGVRKDGGLGLVVLKGQLGYLLEEQAMKLTPKLKILLAELREISEVKANRILDGIEKGEMSTRERIELNIMREGYKVLSATRTWYNSDAITKHFTEFKRIGNEKEVFDSDLDLKCLTHLLLRDCDVPQLCKATYRRDIYSQYMLTHQALYQLAARQKSCSSASPEAFENFELYGDRLCSKAYLEAEFLDSHQFPTRFVDLFAEYGMQMLLFYLMGYPNLMRADWLREILSWREGSASGCMADLYGARKLTDITVQIPVVGRQDGKSEDNCLVHLTSVSLMALSVNLRNMVDVCEPNLFDDYFSARA